MIVGRIYNDNKFRQKHLFDGLERRRSIMPTDIEGAYDIGGKAFIFFEGKSGNEPLIGAQRSFYTSLINAIKHPAIVIVYEHYYPDTEDVIVAGEKVMVREIYSNISKKWQRIKPWTSVLKVIEYFEDTHCKGF